MSFRVKVDQFIHTLIVLDIYKKKFYKLFRDDYVFVCHI